LIVLYLNDTYYNLNEKIIKVKIQGTK